MFLDSENLPDLLNFLLEHIKDNGGIECASRDCRFSNPIGNGCEFKHIQLCNGICRFYMKADKPEYRKDVPEKMLFPLPE